MIRVQYIRFAVILVFAFLVISGLSLKSISADGEKGSGNPTTFISKGNIISVFKETKELFGEPTDFTTVEVIITEDGAEKKVTIEIQNLVEFQEVEFSIGDRVLVDKTTTTDGQEIYYIRDFARTTPIYLLFIIFALLSILVARYKGFYSLIGLGFSFLVLIEFILPQMLEGKDPLLVTIIAAIPIIFINFYLAHGLNRKTTYAVAGTLITLILTGLMSLYFVDWAKLTGYSSDEAAFLSVLSDGQIDIQGILLAGIIIGVLGILDDITVSQASIAHQLKAANPKIKFHELYNRTMEVGKDHIASLVNTLILIYTSAALPLLLLFINSESSFNEIINREIVAEEVVRTLLTSIGLILAVPITTLIAAYFTSKEKNINESKNMHNHVH